ncbi:MAG: CRISPR-associated helicase Cas3' [Candidatus Saccharicenans sp.]|nr:CRISPR-associated helicase Cas3' [Candidatus Saccharicenans sp.]
MRLEEIIENFYPHQIATYRALEKGNSIILRAPTGTGKSEAAFIPFVDLRGKSLPSRMIYALPMRALVNSLQARFKNYSPALDIKVQHGQRTESLLFEAECIVATLDQVITSYACAPLSLGIRHGNIPAGAVAGSFLVFDEVHTFEPLLGLQSSIILAERMKNLGIPFVIMTATLPSGFMNSLAKRMNSEIIEVNEKDLPVRLKREVILHQNLEKKLSPESVLSLYKKHHSRLIVVCNTVARAISLYRELKGKIIPEPILIHSRFLDDDRAKAEKNIENLFGKNGHKEAVLITTQVIEVGMDISCDLLLSELAPIDSLIQRAGRCVRWGGKGEVIVFDIPYHAPYSEKLINLTRKILLDKYGEKLTWELEKQMVDEVLEETFSRLAEPQAGAHAMMYLSKGAFEGKASIAEKAVREALSVEASICDDPAQLGNQVMFLPKCKIHPYTLKKFIKEVRPKAWLVEIDRNAEDDYSSTVESIPLSSETEIQPNKFYVIHSSYASYSPEEGLILGKAGSSLNIQERERKSLDPDLKEIPLETWREHSMKTLKVFEETILPVEDFIYSKLALWLRENKESVLNLIKFALIVHDLGKLNNSWQRAIGATDKFLAHSGNRARRKLPPHATVSAYVLRDYLRQEWGNILGEAAFFAIAHHHSVRAAKVPRYRMRIGWFDEVDNILSEAIGIKLPWECVRSFETQESPTTLSNHFPAFEKEKTYTSYVILSRALRLADRMAVEKVP